RAVVSRRAPPAHRPAGIVVGPTGRGTDAPVGPAGAVHRRRRPQGRAAGPGVVHRPGRRGGGPLPGESGSGCGRTGTDRPGFPGVLPQGARTPPSALTRATLRCSGSRQTSEGFGSLATSATRTSAISLSRSRAALYQMVKWLTDTLNHPTEQR